MIPSIISQKSGIHSSAWILPFREASHLKNCIQETTISVILETDSPLQSRGMHTYQQTILITVSFHSNDSSPNTTHSDQIEKNTLWT